MPLGAREAFDRSLGQDYPGHFFPDPTAQLMGPYCPANGLQAATLIYRSSATVNT